MTNEFENWFNSAFVFFGYEPPQAILIFPSSCYERHWCSFQMELSVPSEGYAFEQHQWGQDQDVGWWWEHWVEQYPHQRSRQKSVKMDAILNDIVQPRQEHGQNGIVAPSEPALIKSCMANVKNVLKSLASSIGTLSPSFWLLNVGRKHCGKKSQAAVRPQCWKIKLCRTTQKLYTMLMEKLMFAPAEPWL